MSKIIRIEVPDWIDEDIIIALRELINEKIKDIILYKRLEDLVNKLKLTYKDLEDFNKTREEVWKEIEEIYKKEGLISNGNHNRL